MLSPHRDTAGQQAALRAALAVHRPDWTVDQMRRISHPFGYPRHRSWDSARARQLWGYADVVHLDQSVALVAKLGGGRARVVVQHHGSEFRDPVRRARSDTLEAGTTRCATTLDLATGDVEWLPVVADLDALRRIRRDVYVPSDIVRVATSPSDPGLKDTEAIVAAVHRLRDRGIPVELDVISGVPWAKCLRRKARADIFVDQLTLGYGLSAVEAWAMGIPVIAGADPELRARMIDAFGHVPFVRADTVTIGEAIEALVLDPAWRIAAGSRGREHAERYHSQAAVVERLDAVYARALQ